MTSGRGVPERTRCHVGDCLMTATHGPAGIAVACWCHAGSFPLVSALPTRACGACNYLFDDNSLCKCGRRVEATNAK